jgi:hypothetical protein
MNALARIRDIETPSDLDLAVMWYGDEGTADHDELEDAERAAAELIALRAQLAASHPRQDHSGAGQETRDALAVVGVLSRHIMEIHRMPHEGHSIAGSYMQCRHELCRDLAALRTGECEG